MRPFTICWASIGVDRKRSRSRASAIHLAEHFMYDAAPVKRKTASHREAPSLRSWLAELDAAGQLRRVKAQVDWDGEIGALTRITLALGGPALLFENIKDHQDTRCTKLL